MADLEAEQSEAGFSLEAEQLYFGIDPYQHFEAEFCLQTAMAADFLPLTADFEIECHLETVFLADLDADHLEAAFHQHFVIDLELQFEADSEAAVRAGFLQLEAGFVLPLVEVSRHWLEADFECQNSEAGP